MPGSREEDFFKKNAFSLFDFMATPLHKTPCPGSHEIDNFGRPFLGHHNYLLGLSDLGLGVEKK